MNRAFSSQQYDDSILSNATGQKLSNSVSAHSLNDNADKFIVVIYKYADYEAGFQEDELQNTLQTECFKSSTSAYA